MDCPVDPPDRPQLARRRRQTQIIVDLARVRAAADRWVEESLAAHGLDDITPAQANVLMVLVNARKPLTGAELARELGITEVTVSRFLKRMASAGWVERQRDPADARRLLVRPTDQAREALPRFIRVSNHLLDAAFAELGPEQVDELARQLSRIRERLEAANRGATGS